MEGKSASAKTDISLDVRQTQRTAKSLLSASAELGVIPQRHREFPDVGSGTDTDCTRVPANPADFIWKSIGSIPTNKAVAARTASH